MRLILGEEMSLPIISLEVEANEDTNGLAEISFVQ